MTDHRLTGIATTAAVNLMQDIRRCSHLELNVTRSAPRLAPWLPAVYSPAQQSKPHRRIFWYVGTHTQAVPKWRQQ